MGLPPSVLNNKLLRGFFADLEAERRAKGRIDGRAALLRTLLEAKFGPLPEWAVARIADGAASQAEAWAKKVLKARSLEAVIGREQAIHSAGPDLIADAEAKGQARVLRIQLKAKFGPLPKWAVARLADGVAAHADVWAKKVLTARSLEAVIGPR